MRVILCLLCAMLFACGGDGGGGDDGPKSGSGGNNKAGSGGAGQDATMPVDASMHVDSATAGSGGGERDGSMPDASMPDTSVPDSSVPDSSVPDSAAADASADGGTMPTTDAGADASAADGGTDAGADASTTCTPQMCALLDTECTQWSCNVTSGACEMTPVNEGAACGTNTAACKTQTCQSGVCVLENRAAGAACGDQGVPCHTDDQCDGLGSCVDKGVLPSGSLCGDRTSTPCNGADTCDASGNCLPNVADVDMICEAAVSDCALPKRCNALLECVATGYKLSGTACGSPSSGLCDSPDTCDGAGLCKQNHAGQGTDCTSASADCRVGDTCNANGACVPGSSLPEGTACGSDSSDECDAADSCDGNGKCLANHASDETLCSGQSFDCVSDAYCDGSGMCQEGALIPGCRLTVSGYVTGSAAVRPDVVVEILNDPEAGQAVTDSNGTFTLSVLPATTLVVYVHPTDDHWGQIIARVVTPQDPTLGTMDLVSDVEMNALASQVSELPALDAGYGIISVTATGALGGESIELGATSSPAIAYDADHIPLLSPMVVAPAYPTLLFTNVVDATTTVTVQGVTGSTACVAKSPTITSWPIESHTITMSEFTCTAL